jgi:hypothetical protein
MKLATILANAEKMGDFYAYYKSRGKGMPFLVGTNDFDNKYILKRATEPGCGLPKPLTGNALEKLENIDAAAHKLNNVLVFNWTRNKFEMLIASEVRRMTTLQSEMRNAGRRKR